MHSEKRRGGTVTRSMAAVDRPAVAEIVQKVGKLNPTGIGVALEPADTNMLDKDQEDYRGAVAETREARICGYICCGSTRLTEGTYGLYWIATHPDVQGSGFGRALMEFRK